MSHELIGDRIYLDGVDIEVDHRGHGSHQASVHRGALAALVRRLLGELPQLERVRDLRRLLPRLRDRSAAHLPLRERRMSEWKTLADRASAWVDSIDKMNRGEDPGDVPPPMPEPLARAFLELHAAVRRVCHDTDWCPVCEHHPSRGHAENCVVV